MKNRIFIISLIIIYLLFLMKDNLFKFYNNLSSVEGNIGQIKDNYYKEEYENISKMIDVQIPDFNIVYSKVVFRNIYEFYDKITIAKGRVNGILENAAVINELGLVGIVNKTNDNYSEVYLLTNSNIEISVKINDAYGILTSKDNKIIVKNIITKEEIKEGDLIYTSGLTNIPEGILIGSVEKVIKDKLGLEYEIYVKAGADAHNINYVGVIGS